MDWDAMNRLHEKGFISNPKGKAKSIVFTDEGAKLSKELFEKYFMEWKRQNEDKRIPSNPKGLLR